LLTVVLLALTVTTGTFASGRAEDPAAVTYTFRYGNQQPETHARSVSMLWFEKELEARTNGRIQVDVYHSGVLGSEREMFEQVVTGNLEGYRGAGYEQLNPAFNLYNLPFLFQSYEEMVHFNASEMAADMCADGSVQGIYIPAIGYTGFRALMTKDRQVLMPEDLRGVKMRVPGQAPVISFYRHFGANPQEIPFGEVYLAMRQGVVDGGDNAPTNILAANLHEVGSYFTSLNYMAGADPFMVNMAWYQALPADLKETFNQVSREALAYWDELESENSLKAIAEISAKPGVTGVDMTAYPERLAVWEEASQPLWDQFVAEGFFSQADITRAQAIIAEVRK
jgi:C4-dicarboxylate-binding protein DctP